MKLFVHLVVFFIGINSIYSQGNKGLVSTSTDASTTQVPRYNGTAWDVDSISEESYPVLLKNHLVG